MYKQLVSMMLCFTIALLIISPASAQENVTTTSSIESFAVETYSELPNQEGIFEKTGYKRVNSEAEVELQNELPEYTKLSTVEDFYDLNGNYIETIVSVNEYKNNYSNGKAKERSKTKKVNSPQVIETGYFDVEK